MTTDEWEAMTQNTKQTLLAALEVARQKHMADSAAASKPPYDAPVAPLRRRRRR